MQGWEEMQYLVHCPFFSQPKDNSFSSQDFIKTKQNKTNFIDYRITQSFKPWLISKNIHLNFRFSQSAIKNIFILVFNYSYCNAILIWYRPIYLSDLKG